jgi:hypothetical protein
MKSRAASYKSVFLLVLIGGASCSPTRAPSPAPLDRVGAVPGTKVLMENECVRVQYHDAGVGETIPMHTHPAYVVYTLQAFRARIRLADGTQRISDRKAGEAYWNEPITHSVENLGSTPIHNLIVEMKPDGKCR